MQKAHGPDILLIKDKIPKLSQNYL